MNSFEYLEELLQKELKPQEGLPEPVFEFVSSVTPMVNVDLLVRDKTEGYCWRGGKINFQVRYGIFQEGL